METIRLQSALSHAGIASRRKAAAIIEEGRVFVNDKSVREKGCQVNPDKDKIEVDGRLLKFGKKIYIIMNKPKGVLTSRFDPQGRKTVYDILPPEFKELHPVGRLDKDTTGLLLLTNDGDFTYKLTHPKFEIRKKYTVVCDGRVGDKDKERLERGLPIDGKKTARAKVEIIRTGDERSDLFIEIHEGKKRQIRNMFLFLGHPIVRLERVAYEFLKLGALKPGEFRRLSAGEIQRLKEL